MPTSISIKSASLNDLQKGNMVKKKIKVNLTNLKRPFITTRVVPGAIQHNFIRPIKEDAGQAQVCFEFWYQSFERFFRTFF